MKVSHSAAILAAADLGLAFVLPFKLPTFALPTLPALPLPSIALPFIALPLPPGLPFPKTSTTKAPITTTKPTTSAKVGTGTATPPPLSNSGRGTTATIVSPPVSLSRSPSTGIASSKGVSSSPSASVVLPTRGSSSSFSIVTITDPRQTKSTGVSVSTLKPVSSGSTVKSAGSSSFSTVKPANSGSASSTRIASTGSLSTLRSASASIGSASQSASRSATSSSKGGFIFTGCTVNLTSFTTTTITPIATLPTYVNVIQTINEDDFEGPRPTVSLTTITNDYTTSISSTLTITSTSLPAEFSGYTTTVTEYPPSGFRPVQDTLPSAGFYGQFGGPNPFDAKRKEAREVTSTCKLIRVTKTVTSTLPTRVQFTTITSAVTAFAFPQEDFTAFPYQFTTPPYIVTKVVGTPTSIYEATTTITSTITAPTATKTMYAACAPSNLANYVQFPNGTRFNVTDLTFGGGQRDFNFDIADSTTKIPTAYDCCAYAITQQASSWLFIDVDFCVALYPTGSQQKHLCLGQNDVQSQFEAEYAESPYRRVVGNGYCGQLSSSLYSTGFST